MTMLGPWRLWALCLAALGVLGLCAALVPDGPEALILILPWLGALAVHLLALPPALVLAWRREQHLAFGVVFVYTLVVAGSQLWLWASVNEVPQRLAESWRGFRAPADQALLEAVRGGRLDAARLATLRAGGADPTRVDFAADLLQAAAGHADGVALAALLEAGLPLDAGAAARALASAVRNGRDGVMQQLLAAGVDPDGAALGAPPPLCTAVNAGIAGDLDPARLARVEALLAAGADARAACGATRTPLLAAIDQRQRNTLARFLARGARLDGRRAELVARTLDEAMRTGDARLVGLLLDLGAPAAAALGYAVERRDPAMLAVLLAHGADAAAAPYLNRAVTDARGDAVVELLLAHGADAGLTDARGRDALAALSPRRADRDLMRRLVAAGADPTLSRVDGVPLLIKRLTPVPDEREFVFALLELGADPDVADAGGRTALMHASRMQDLAFIEALLAAGADPARRDAEGHGVLHHALETADRPAVVQRLLAAGAPAGARDADGESAFCLARRLGRGAVDLLPAADDPCPPAR
ncbi:MAG: ankyrin repeat domain-containing protein [Gammaproteobacteria bacterium]|nr:ankyrin repeat domain-containing protein [Gammaproteobacteria bacterium]